MNFVVDDYSPVIQSVYDDVRLVFCSIFVITVMGDGDGPGNFLINSSMYMLFWG